MTLAPYYVLWAFCAGALGLVTLGVLWLVARNAIAALVGRLWVSDVIALWLAFAGIYHAVFFVLGPFGEVLESHRGIWLIWAIAGVYLALRVAPGPLRHRTVLFAFALAGWAWSIGAGYLFLDELQRSAVELRERPRAVLAVSSPDVRPLRKALFLNELSAGQRARTAELLAAMAAPGGADPARLSGAGQTLVPELLEHFRRDLSRLRTYQALQLLLLGAVLLGWGFGKPLPA